MIQGGKEMAIHTQARPIPTQQRRPPRLLDLDPGRFYSGPAELDPEAATTLIAKYNIGNRRIRWNFVDYLVRVIQNGEWQHDHPQPIVFSAQRMIDGQHRLLAIAKAGQSLLVNVVMGVRDELREYIDTGISRTLEDRVAFVPDDPKLNSAVSQLVSVAYYIVRKVKPTPSEALDEFASHREGYLFAGSYKTRKQRGISRGPALVALMEMYERDQSKATEFADSMCSPDGSIQPTRRLREWLIANPRYHGAMARQEYGKAICAMKAYMEGRTIASLRVSSW